MAPHLQRLYNAPQLIRSPNVSGTSLSKRLIVSMPKVTIANEKREIDVASGANLRAALRDAGVQVYSGIHRLANCRGLGFCGTCRVLVKKGMENLSAKGFMERFRLGVSVASIGQEDEMRLSCQTEVKGDCTIETRPAFNVSGDNFWQKPYPNK
jgi:ferredoxin